MQKHLDQRPDPVVVVAALKRELAPLRQGMYSNALTLATGEGPANAKNVLRSFLKEHPVRCVIGVGFAGALSPSLQPADLLIGQIIDGGGPMGSSNMQLMEFARKTKMERLHFGAILSSPRILCRAEEKRQMGRNAAASLACVDMESAAYAEVSRRAGVPFLAIRCITDLLEEDLPVDFNSCLNKDGHVNYAKVLLHALGRPSAISGLLKLRRRAQICSERLAKCVAQLEPSLQNFEEVIED